MSSKFSPKWLTFGILLFIVACSTNSTIPTGNPDPSPTKTGREVSTPELSPTKAGTKAPTPYLSPTQFEIVTPTPYPMPTEGADSQSPSTPKVPKPTSGTEAKERYASRVLDPYFANLPFIEQALTSHGIYSEYFGCVDNNDVGRVVAFNVKLSSDTTLERFDQYLAQLSMETDGWEKIEIKDFLGEAVILYAKHLPDEELPLLLTMTISVANPSNPSDPKYMSDLYMIWFEVTAIENSGDYEDRDNKAEALFNNCPDQKFWLKINP